MKTYSHGYYLTRFPHSFVSIDDRLYEVGCALIHRKANDNRPQVLVAGGSDRDLFQGLKALNLWSLPSMYPGHIAQSRDRIYPTCHRCQCYTLLSLASPPALPPAN